DDRNLQLWDTNRGRKKLELRLSERPVDVALAPTADYLVVTTKTNQIEIRSLPTGHVVRAFDAPPGGYTQLAFSPDGSRFTFASEEGGLRQWDLKTGREHTQSHAHSGSVLSLEATRNGESLLSASRDGLALCWDVKSGQPICTFRGHRG